MARRAEPGKRRLILATARELFRRQGYTRTTMSQISEQSGIAHGTVYFYFNSKLDVADALVEEYINGISRILNDSLSGSLGPEQIRVCMHNVLLYASKNSDIARLQHVRSNLDIDNSRPPDDLKPQRILGNAISEGIRRGRIREYDPLAAAELISGLVEWIVRICFVRARCETSRIEETAVRMLEYALIKS